jgi:hypothetical protein
MARREIGWIWGSLLTLTCVVAARCAHAAPLDEAGDITLSVRAYTAARVGTQDTDIQLLQQAPRAACSPTNQADCFTQKSLTFPISAAGHLRQHRTFIEAELDHDLNRLLEEGFGPLALFHSLPFQFRKLSYTLTYRGEYEGVYDYGPSEYRTHRQYTPTLLPPNPINGMPVDVALSRGRLRRVAVLRNRLFQGYVQAEVGKLFMRFGRQILAWGETDVFRLIDNINPLDNSFGGFLIPLDERRVPIDMLRASYLIGEIPWTPFYEAYLEGFGAIDDAVGWNPGIPDGSPWQLPNFLPSATLTTVRATPPRTIARARGGAQFKFISPVPGIETATFALAHYYTYLDNPGVQVTTQAFPAPIPPDSLGAGFQALAVQTAPLVQISGATASFAIPPEWARLVGFTSEPIVRSEFAYFHNEPRWSQSQLDPFVFAFSRNAEGQICSFPGVSVPGPNGQCSGGRRTGDSVNFMLGLDTQQRIRFLNPDASFFITTQFFYKHLRDAVKRRAIQTPFPALPGQPPIFDGEVLPVQRAVYSPDRWGLPTAAAEPDFVHNAVDQYLQTLLIFTTYAGGAITPSLGILFDWSGSVVVQPQVTLLRDPFRFIMGYNYLWAGDLRGNSGTSLLRDRDNLLFQFEYSL